MGALSHSAAKPDRLPKSSRRTGAPSPPSPSSRFLRQAIRSASDAASDASAASACPRDGAATEM